MLHPAFESILTYLVGRKYIKDNKLEDLVEEADDMPWYFLRYGLALLFHGVDKLSPGFWNGECQFSEQNWNAMDTEVTDTMFDILGNLAIKNRLAALFQSSQNYP
jgi:hypothetical protein